MFADLLKRLTAPSPTIEAEADYKVALAALLVRAARADNDYSPVEANAIDRVLVARYAFTSDQAEALRKEGEQAETEAPDTVRLTRAIKDGVPYEERQAVIEALWCIVLADEEREEHENALLRLVTSLIGVNDRDSNIARQRAAKRIEKGL